MAKKKFLARIPKGIAAYAYFHKPDTGHKYSNGKYKGTVVLDGDVDLSDLKAKALAAAEHEWGDKFDPDDLKLPFFEYEGDKEEFQGKVLVKASTKYAPKIVDAKRNALKKGIQARSGDLVTLVVNLIPYEKTEKVKEGKKLIDVKTQGISAQLNIVQLIKKGAGGGGLELLEDEEGDDFDDYDAEDQTDDEDTDDNDGDY